MGIVCPLGWNTEPVLYNILGCKSCVSTINSFDTRDFSVHIAASVPEDFDISEYLPGKDARKFDGFVQYGVYAAAKAMEDAGLTITDDIAPRAGVAIGSGIGGASFLEKLWETLWTSAPRKVSPFAIPGSLINMVAGKVSMMYNLLGPNISVVTACTTGTHNIGEAYRKIQYGDADIMLAGGAEKAITPLGLGGFCAARALSTRNDAPELASRPWDKDRDGFVMGDGAGVVVLEELEHAKARGAKIYAEVVGYGLTGDAYHITAPSPEGDGAYRCMKAAMKRAGLNPEDIDYVNAHGTSTMADVIELGAVKRAFGNAVNDLSMSSTKSAIGHLLGAAGAVEAIFSILAVQNGVVPPTLNLDNPDEGCDIDLVPHQAKERKVRAALSNSFGFGGTNASLIVKSFD